MVMRVVGQCSRMRRTNRRRWVLTSLPSGVFSRAQDGQHAMAGVGVIDMDRQEAALTVMRIEQRQLLMAMQGDCGVVDIEGDRLGRICSHFESGLDNQSLRDFRRLYHARQRIPAVRC